VIENGQYCFNDEGAFMKNRDSTEDIFKEIDKIALLLSVGVLIFLIVLYFWFLEIATVSENVRQFAEAIITNLIPTFLLFCVSYLLIRRFQILRTKHSQQQFVDDITKAIDPVMSNKIAGLNGSIEKLAERIREVQETLMSLWQNQEYSQRTIDQLIAKLPVTTFEDVAGFYGSENKISKNPRLPKARVNLHNLGDDEDED
jgi:hypothetical protein